jgi:hypothetical protein
MQQIDPCDEENSLEDMMARQQDKCLRAANSIHVKGDDKHTCSVQKNSFAQGNDYR